MVPKRERKPQVNNLPSRTQQHHAPMADINNIVGRHKSGHVPGDPTGARQPFFGQWSAPDFHGNLNYVVDVQQRFAALPARTRSRFNNDPYQLLRFVDDPKNRSESLLMGLVEPTEVEAAAMYRAKAKAFRVEQIDLEREIAAEAAKAARLKAAEQAPPEGEA